MSWRCQECDYLGEEIIETDEHDEGCPECGGYCIEVNEMTDEQEEMLENFFNENKEAFLIPPGNQKIDDLNQRFRWDDCQEASKVIKALPNIHVYTVVDCEEEQAWLVEGQRFVNRIAYYLTSKKIEIPEEGLRYW